MLHIIYDNPNHILKLNICSSSAWMQITLQETTPSSCQYSTKINLERCENFSRYVIHFGISIFMLKLLLHENTVERMDSFKSSG